MAIASYRMSWRLGFRLRRWSGWSESCRPGRAASRVHGGTKARETSVARIGAMVSPILDPITSDEQRGLRHETIRIALMTGIFAAALLAAGCGSPAGAAPKKEFNIAWTIYVGWMPWPYAADAGIVKKWADKYGITINVTQINDYVESINQYTAGKFDGVTVTNMDALTIPAAGGVDTSAIIMGDFSNGNDGIVLKKRQDARRHQGPARSTSSSCRCRTICWRAGWRPSSSRRRTSRPSTPRTPTSSPPSSRRIRPRSSPGIRSSWR